MSARRRHTKITYISHNQSRKKSENYLLKIPALLNTYLCFHGLTSAGKFEISCKNLFLYAVSIIFMVINEVNKLYFIQFLSVNLHVSQNKRSRNVLIILLILDYLIRILFFIKRNKLNHIIHRMLKLYSAIVTQMDFKYAVNLTLMLVINDICTISTFYFHFLMPNTSFSFRKQVDNFTFGYLSVPISTTLYYFCIFMEMWGILTPLIPVYFCCFCFALKTIINEFNKRLRKASHIDFNFCEEICTKLLNLTSDINAAFHSMLLVAIIFHIGHVFYHSYNWLTSKTSTWFILAYRIPSISIAFIRFLIICIFASSASKAGSELKRTICNVAFRKEDRWKYLRLVIKTNDSFVEFKLLDSLVIDRNLILSSIGGIVTYGIIIATFNVNSNN